MEGAMQKELSTQDLNGRPGRRWVPAGDGVRGAPQARSWLRPGMTSPGLKHSGADPTFLTVCWVLRVWGPVFFKSFFMRVALSPCALSLPKLASGLSAGLVGDETARVLLRWGGGVVFLKATSYVCLSSSFVPFTPPLRCSGSPPYFAPTSSP